jgi:hypothetical protein
VLGNIAAGDRRLAPGVAARQHVSYSEDVDRVVEILRQASAELIEDEALGH